MPNRINISDLRVLIVEDDVFMLEVVKDMLEQLSVVDIHKATNGEEALSQLDKYAFHLIICDLSMPKMDGVEFLRHLAKSDFGGSVAISSELDQKLIDAAGRLVEEHSLDLKGVLQKPFSLDSLSAVISKTLENQKRHKQQFAASYLLPFEKVRDAIVNDRLILHYQPKVDAATGRATGAESLVRLLDDDGGIVPPFAFIDVAEKNGLMDLLTYSVYEKAVKQLAIWQQEGLDIKISINLSEVNLKQLGFPETLANLAKKYKVQSSKIILEITETSVGGSMVTSLEIMTRLRMLGFGLSIDDFGTGYSSMEKLQQFPFSELKIDRQFVSGANESSKAFPILKHSVQLGSDLKMNVVAEGAETQAEMQFLQALGCNEIQGFFISKPLSAEAFKDWYISQAN